jgi:hypothetical protein
MNKETVKQKAIDLAERFNKHGYPFASGSGFMTGQLDAKEQYRSACRISVTFCEIYIEELILDDAFKLEIDFWKDVKIELEEMIKS